MINILYNLALFWAKNANFFAEFFGENILKIITSVPDIGYIYIEIFYNFGFDFYIKHLHVALVAPRPGVDLMNQNRP
jgi:hypothetical protein